MAEIVSGSVFSGYEGISALGAVHGGRGGQLEGTLASTLTSALKDAAVTVSRTVATGNRDKLEEIGRKVSAQAIFAATEPLPGFVRSWVSPGFVQPKPAPQWVTDMVDPFIEPIMAGAKAEALTVARRITKPLYITVFAVILTVFGLGYMFGHKKGVQEVGHGQQESGT